MTFGISIFRISERSALCFYILIMASGCRENIADPDPAPDKMIIETVATETYSGATIQLSAFVTQENGTRREVTTDASWSTTPGQFGEITAQGLFSGTDQNGGVEQVTAAYQTLEATITIDVVPKMQLFAISPAVVNVAAGQSVQFQAYGTLPGGSEAFLTERAVWTVSPGLAAQIDENGLLQPSGGIGLEVVTATFQDFSEQGAVEVQTVYQPRFDMIEVPAGSFTMGNNSGTADQQPEHSVFIDAFALGKYEITNAQYVEYLNASTARDEIALENGFIFRIKPPHRFFHMTKISDVDNGEYDELFITTLPDEEVIFKVIPGYENYPKLRMNWYGAKLFCEFYGLRLPTEAEWEKAARGESQALYATSDGTLSHELANYAGTGGRDQFATVAPVGSFPPNSLGFFDLCGNVAEAVYDVYAADYYANSPMQNPTGPGPSMAIGVESQGIQNIWRGGFWQSTPQQVTTTSRGLKDIHNHSSEFRKLHTANMGIRVALSLP